jgi:hypothetical protein
MNDLEIITGAAILANLIEGGETLSTSSIISISTILKEMRLETEVARLARRVTALYKTETPRLELIL